MTDITAAMVKELRESTGAGMLDCKKALTEAAGDMEKAVDWLRKKGLASAAKKASRVAAEGLVAVTVYGNKGAIVEVNSETDFVAKNEIFQEYVEDAAKVALANDGDVEAMKAAVCAKVGKPFGERLTDLIELAFWSLWNLRQTKKNCVNSASILLCISLLLILCSTQLPMLILLPLNTKNLFIPNKLKLPVNLKILLKKWLKAVFVNITMKLFWKNKLILWIRIRRLSKLLPMPKKSLALRLK